jgi:hypothetical protein
VQDKKKHFLLINCKQVAKTKYVHLEKSAASAAIAKCKVQTIHFDQISDLKTKKIHEF